jgi:hypothetical protein
MAFFWPLVLTVKQWSQSDAIADQDFDDVARVIFPKVLRRECWVYGNRGSLR